MAYHEEGIKRLHLAVVIQAIDDLKQDPNNKLLRSWLLNDGLFILESYNQQIANSTWERLIDEGFPNRSKLRRR